MVKLEKESMIVKGNTKQKKTANDPQKLTEVQSFRLDMKSYVGYSSIMRKLLTVANGRRFQKEQMGNLTRDL